MPAETHTHSGPVDRGEVVAVIVDRLSELLAVDPSTISEGSRFIEYLGTDSLVMVNLLDMLEEEFGERTVGFEIDDEDLDDLRTVGETADYIVSRLG